MNRRQQGKGIAAVIASATVLGLGAVAVGVAASTPPVNEELIAPGVQVAGVPVGGLTRAAAAEKVRAWARTAVAAPVTFVAPRSGRRWNLALHDAGGRFDVEPAVDAAYRIGRGGTWVTRLVERFRPPHYAVELEPEFHFDESKLEKALAPIAGAIRVPARNVRARREGAVLVVTRPERKGVRLDVNSTVHALLQNGEQALRDGGKATLVVTEELPALRGDDLGVVSHELASYSTSYGSSIANRRHNVEKAAAYIDGTLLAPGDVFSYNDVVGPRTRRRGWRTAPEYLRGEVVQGTGGGVCQPSSTLYNAVLLANLKIVERTNHSMPVAYVPAGRDATVSYGSLDLRFQNSTDAPIYIAARAGRGRLTMAIYGKEPAVKPDVRIVSGARRGRRNGGFAVSTWRVVRTADGEERREYLSTSSYKPHVEASPSRPRRRTAAARRARRPAPRTIPASRPAPAPEPATTPPSA